MNTVPEITSAGALWASTPLLAAAQLWSWHPLWAASIWTVYGIGALVPQGQAWLKPLIESPLHARFDPLNPACGTQGLKSITVGTATYDKTTSIVVTSTSATSSPETTGQLTKDDLSTSTTTVKATRINGPSALVPANNHPTFVRSSSSTTPATTPQVPFSPSVLSNVPDSIDAPHTSSPSTSIESTRPSTESDVKLFSYPTPASTSDRPTSTPNPLIDPYHNEHGYDQFRWGQLGNYEIHGLSLELWVAFTFSWTVLITILGLSLWKFWVATRPGFMWAWKFLAGLDIPQRVRLWYNAGVQRVRNVQFKDQTPHRFKNTYRTRLLINICKQILHSLLVELQVPDKVVHAAIAIRQWFANLIWGGQTRFTRFLSAGMLYAACLIVISYPCWLLSLLVDSMLSAAFRAIVVMVKGIQTTGATPEFTSSSPMSTVATNSTSTSTVSTAFTCLSQIKRCTVSAFQNRLSPNGTYNPSLTSLSRTGAICSWIEATVMNLRSIPFLLQKFSNTAIKNYYSAAWGNRLSPTGHYLRARQSGATASLCETIGWLAKSCRGALQTLKPAFTALNHTLGPSKRFAGCFPIIATFSGSRYPIWTWHLNHVVTLTLLTVLFSLNVGAISMWPAPESRSAAALAKRAAVVACLMFVPQEMLVAFLWTTRSSIELGLLITVATYGLCWFFREGLAMKWNAVLRRFGIAPVDGFQGQGRTV